MTKNNLIIILGTLFSVNLYGQSCQGIPDGKVERLDAPGRPLQNLKTQDQDGLGTCYANTASVLLQGRLKDNPEVSYLNLAFMYAEKYAAPKVRQNGKDSGFQEKKNPTEDESFLVEGGHTCDAIMTAKERGGICKRSDVALEQFFHSGSSPIASDSAWIQKDLVLKLSKYYDGIFKDFGREEKQTPSKIAAWLSPKPKTSKFEEYKAALKNVLQKNKDRYTAEQCLKPDIRNAETVVSNLLARVYQFSNNTNNLKNKNYRNVSDSGRKLGFTIKYIRNGNFALEATVNDATKKILKDEYIKELSAGTNPNAEAVLIKSLQKVAPGINAKFLSAIGDFSSEDKSLLAQDADRYFYKKIDECMNQAKLEYFTNDEGLIKDFANDTCLSKYSDHANNIRQLVTTLDKANMKNIDSLYSFLMDLPEMNYEQAMMKMVGPDCPDDKKIKIPDDLQCEGASIYYSADPKTPETDAKFLTETKTKLQNAATEAMIKGNPIGLSLCTGFFDKDTPDAFYNKTSQCPTTKHGFHAVALIGYRCQAGKIQYLVQNSWGDWGAAKERFTDTEPGKAWINEEELAKNVYRFDMIK